ncbi:hypothetical protein ACXO4I_08235 [Lactobacillus delbrueckii subsp. bulgaricus]|nr:hypothetical protein [Lactobacillus delbrueckii subsp. bulgaricus]MBT9022622.1 hypothetical protein [Lactobacillus delbrueckii subsp. bulgaricus]
MMTKTEKTFSTIIKTVNCLMFLTEAVLICFMGAELVGFQTKAKDLTIGWSLIIASVALVLAAILIWTSKFSVLFWITEVALLASFIILTIFRIMDVGTAFDILGSAAILALIRYGKFTKPYIGPIVVVAIDLAYLLLLIFYYDFFNFSY